MKTTEKTPESHPCLGFPERFRALMEVKKKSTNCLAETLGCDPSTIKNLRSGAKNPSLGFFIRLASALEVSLDELAGIGNPPVARQIQPPAPALPGWLLPWLPALDGLDRKGREAVIAFFRVLIPAAGETSPPARHPSLGTVAQEPETAGKPSRT